MLDSKFKKIITGVVIALAIVFSTYLVIYAIAYYRSDPTTTITVQKPDLHKFDLTNNSTTSLSYFIPNNSQPEVDSFVTAAKAGLAGLAIYPWLANDIHKQTDCVAATGVGGGTGTVQTDGTNYLCQFNGASCPTGWTAYNNWSTTSNTAVSYYSGYYTGCGSACQIAYYTCNSGFHAWNNIATESAACLGSSQSITCWCCTYNCWGSGWVTATAVRTQIGCY